MTIIRSISVSVDKRCAMASTVLPSITRDNASWIDASTSESSALVASSNTRIGASLMNGTRKGDPLALPARQFHTALAQMRVVTGAPFVVLQVLDKGMRLGFCRRRNHLVLGRVGLAVANVVHRRAVEHRGFLRDHSDAAAQAFLGDLARISTVDFNRPFFGVIQPQQQCNERRFTRTRGPDNAQLFASANRQVNLLDPAFVATVGKTKSLQRDLAPWHLQIIASLAFSTRVRGVRVRMPSSISPMLE